MNKNRPVVTALLSMVSLGKVAIIDSASAPSIEELADELERLKSMVKIDAQELTIHELPEIDYKYDYSKPSKYELAQQRYQKEQNKLRQRHHRRK